MSALNSLLSITRANKPTQSLRQPTRGVDIGAIEAKAFGQKLIHHPVAEKMLRERIIKMGNEEILWDIVKNGKK